MPRIVEITIPPDRTESLLDEIRKTPGLIGARVQRGISVQTPGDVVSAQMSSGGLHELMRRLAILGIAADGDSSITTSDPNSIVAKPMARAIAGDKSEAAWEEIEYALGKEGNMSGNALAVMFLSGILAAAGIASNALHIVIGAMVIAPGFEPIVRVAFGSVIRGVAWGRGLYDMLKGYGIMILGAVLATLILDLSGKPPLGGEESYLPSGVLVSYWTKLTVSSLMVSFAAALAGAFVVIANRSVLTAGVMIALALVPAAAITGACPSFRGNGLSPARASCAWWWKSQPFSSAPSRFLPEEDSGSDAARF